MPCSREEFIRLMKEEAGDVECDTCTPGQLELTEPPWFNEKLFTRGRKYMLSNLAAQMGACLVGLISVLAVPSSLQIILYTNKSSTTLSAYRRYLSTILHVYSWLRSDLHPGTVSWKSLLTVRKRHLRVNKAAIKSGDGRITQRDLVITLFGFFGYSLLKPEKVGMCVDSQEDIEAYLHFWRTIGFMVGIHDKYNFCDGSVNEVKEKMQYICEDFCKPCLANPPEHYYHTVKALLDGMFYVTIFIRTKPYLYFTYRLNDMPGFKTKRDMIEERRNTVENTVEKYTERSENEYRIEITNEKSVTDTNSNDLKSYNCLDGERLLKSMTVVERSLFGGMISIFQDVFRSWIGRWVYNTYFSVTFFVLQYVPYVAILRFGIKRTYVNMFVEDVAEQTTSKTNRQVLGELYGKN